MNRSMIRYFCCAAIAAVWVLGGAGCREVGPISIEETPIKILSESIGHGKQAKIGDVVCIAYKIKLPNGDIVLSDDEFCMELGGGSVIVGIDEGVVGMRSKGKRTIECPPHKHWGAKGYGDGKIPPNTFLTLEITLQSID